jgi:hypothetical protein
MKRKKVLITIIAIVLVTIATVSAFLVINQNSVKVGDYITISGTMSGLTKGDLGASTVWTISDSRGLFLIEDYNVYTGQWYLVSGMSSKYEDYYNHYVIISGTVGEYTGTTGIKYNTIKEQSITLKT